MSFSSFWGSCDVSQILNDFLRVFSLTCAGFTSAKNSLVLAILQHAPVSSVGDGVHVRGYLVPLLSLVHLNHLLCVDRVHLVRVHHYTEQPRVGIDQRRVVPLLQVVQHRSLVQARHVRHVLHLVELGRVHLVDVVLAERLPRQPSSWRTRTHSPCWAPTPASSASSRPAAP